MPYNGTTPPPKPQHPDRDLSARDKSGCRDALFVLGGFLLSFALVIGGCAAYLGHTLNFNLDSGYEPRNHLREIRISKSACPNVVVMHKAANTFQRATPVFGILVDTNGNTLTWPQTKAHLLQAANQLDFFIVASTPKFPPRVQRYLAKVHTDLSAGRVQLMAARDETDFSDRTAKLLGDGQLAFGYAGDLIGHQCPVPLGADASALLAPVRVPPTTTTTIIPPHTGRFRKR